MRKEIRPDGNLITRLFFRLLPIQILLCAIGAVNSTISSLFASNHIGAAAMSAIGLYNPINMFVNAMTSLLVLGATIICGKFMGAQQMEKTQSVFSMDILVSVLFSGITIALHLMAVAFGWMWLFTKDQEVYMYLNQYVLGRAIGILPFVLGQQLAAFLSLENRRVRTTVASVVFLVVNLVANYVFVAVLKMQAFGIALASSVGLVIFFGIELSHYFSKSAMMKLRFKGMAIKDLGDIFKTGFPCALGDGYQAIRGLIVNTLLTMYAGSMGISAYTTALTFMGLFWAIPGAMMNVTRMLMSVSVGEQDRQTLTDVMRNMYRWCIPIMVVIAGILTVLAVPITKLYYKDPTQDVFMMTVWGIRLMPVVMPLALPSMAAFAYGQASGKQGLVNVLSAFDGVVGVVLFSLILMPSMSLNGLYLAIILNSVAAGIFIVYGYSVIRNRRLPRNMDEFMVIPAGFGVSDKDRMDVSVRSMDDVVRVSAKVSAFCREKGIDERRSYLAGLFLEEMAGNVVDHGFRKDRKKHSVDIRVVHKDDDLILRIKDDCKPFDPKERKDIMDPEDPMKNIGIRMVYAMASKTDHRNLLGLNVLTLTLSK